MQTKEPKQDNQISAKVTYDWRRVTIVLRIINMPKNLKVNDIMQKQIELQLLAVCHVQYDSLIYM